MSVSCEETDEVHYGNRQIHRINVHTIAMNQQVQRLPMEKLIERDKIVVERICNDDNFAYYFFHEKCRPLFSHIIWTIYNNNADYDELVNDLYAYLKEPNEDGKYWYRLNTFNYRTSLFDWIKTVAIRKFYTPSSEVFSIPERMFELGVAKDLFLQIKIAKYRNFLYYNYILNLTGTQLLDKLGIEESQVSVLSRSSIKYFKNFLKNNHPEYYDIFFCDKSANKGIVPISPNLSVTSGEKNVVELSIDVQNYMASMPNERYRYVIKSIFLDDKSPEELSEELNTPVSNIYNIKSRGIEQLRDIAIVSGEVDKIDKFINMIDSDRYRKIIHSIFIDKDDYDTICLELGLTKSQFTNEKKAAMKELKSLIFKK